MGDKLAIGETNGRAPSSAPMFINGSSDDACTEAWRDAAGSTDGVTGLRDGDGVTNDNGKVCGGEASGESDERSGRQQENPAKSESRQRRTRQRPALGRKQSSRALDRAL